MTGRLEVRRPAGGPGITETVADVTRLPGGAVTIRYRGRPVRERYASLDRLAAALHPADTLHLV